MVLHFTEKTIESDDYLSIDIYTSIPHWVLLVVSVSAIFDVAGPRKLIHVGFSQLHKVTTYKVLKYLMLLPLFHPSTHNYSFEKQIGTKNNVCFKSDDYTVLYRFSPPFRIFQYLSSRNSMTLIQMLVDR